MANAKRRLVKISTIIRSAAFVRGFSDRVKGKPFAYDLYPNSNAQWDYERGRQLAGVYTGPIKQGAKVTREAILAFALHWKDSII